MRSTKKAPKKLTVNLLKSPHVIAIVLLLLSFIMFDIYLATAAEDKQAPVRAEQKKVAAIDKKSDSAKKEDGHDNDKHGEEESHGEKVKLTAEQQKNGNIQLATAGPVKINQTLPLYGVITPNAEGVQKVRARFPGVIRQFNRKQGDYVAAGDVLATIESNESLKVYKVTATKAGVITDRFGAEGDQTNDDPLFTIADTSSVWVELSVFPRDVVLLQRGQEVRIEQAQRNLVGKGLITYLSANANPVNQSSGARVLLENPEAKWIPGHFVKANVIMAQSTVPVAVSNEALQSFEGKTVVFIKDKDGFEPRPVELGRADSEYTEITSGLSAKEVYVARNSFILKSDMGKESAEHGH